MKKWTYPVKQSDPPLSPRETLPSMYDLPSENPEEPGLPDEYHDLQPQLLSRTFRCHRYPPKRVFTGSDMNLYYDVRHTLWYKRPDWFLVVGVPSLYDDIDLRNSYVVWQEGINPFVVVELLSPGTEKEDLGEYADAELEEIVNVLPVATEASSVVETVLEQRNGQTAKEKPPRKWDVYEQILRVPYYVVFSRYTNRLRFFQLLGGHYQEQVLDQNHPRLWIGELEMGIGLWQGEFEGITRLWLRWYDEQGWILTDTEQERHRKELALAQAEQEKQRAEQEKQRAEQEKQRAEQEKQRAEQEKQRAEQAETQLQQVVRSLFQSGMPEEQIAQLTRLSEEQLRQLVSE